MTDREQLAYACMAALEASREANSYQEAADEGHGTPEAAATAHAEMERLGADFIIEFSKLVAGHRYMARRMEHENRRELATGREFRGGSAA